MAEGGVADDKLHLPKMDDSTETNQKMNNSDILHDICYDYAGFLSVDLHKERQRFHEVIDDLLTKLDEYISFSDLIKSDVNLTLDSTLANIQIKSRDMAQHFDRIDRLECESAIEITLPSAVVRFSTTVPDLGFIVDVHLNMSDMHVAQTFMAAMKRNVGELEVEVEKAESDMGTFGSIKKALSGVSLPSLFTPKSQVRPPVPSVSPVYRPIRVLNTDDFFEKQTPDSPEIGLRLPSAVNSSMEDRLNSGDYHLQSTNPAVSDAATDVDSSMIADVSAPGPDVVDVVNNVETSNMDDSPSACAVIDAASIDAADKSDNPLSQDDNDQELCERVTESSVMELPRA